MVSETIKRTKALIDIKYIGKRDFTYKEETLSNKIECLYHFWNKTDILKPLGCPWYKMLYKLDKRKQQTFETK